MQQELAGLAMEKAVFQVRLWQEEDPASPVIVDGRGYAATGAEWTGWSS